MTPVQEIRRRQCMSAAGSGTSNAYNEESKVHSTANVVKDCEQLPIDALDKSTTVCTISSMAFSLCNQIGQGVACGLLSTASAGFAFLTTTASVNKQFNGVNKQFNEVNKQLNEATTQRDLILASLNLQRLISDKQSLKLDKESLKSEIFRLQISEQLRKATSEISEQLRMATSDATGTTKNDVTKNDMVEEIEKETTTNDATKKAIEQKIAEIKEIEEQIDMKEGEIKQLQRKLANKQKPLMHDTQDAYQPANY